MIKQSMLKVDQNFIKKKLDSSLICTPYISTNRQLADILFKELASQPFLETMHQEWIPIAQF